MSNHIISMAYKRDLRTAMRKSVMVLLADKASDDGSGVYASKQTMADELCCSKQTVIDTIKGFLEEGLISELGRRGNLRGYTVEYGINLDALEALPLVACHAARQSRGLTGQAAGPVKGRRPTGQPAGPKPSLNHPIKQTQVARALPDDWHPVTFGTGTKSLDVVNGWPPGELEAQLEHFTAHHRAKGSRFKDWQDAWSTWVLNSRRFGKREYDRHHDQSRGESRNPMVRAVLARQNERDTGRQAGNPLVRAGLAFEAEHAARSETDFE